MSLAPTSDLICALLAMRLSGHCHHPISKCGRCLSATPNHFELTWDNNGTAYWPPTNDEMTLLNSSETPFCPHSPNHLPSPPKFTSSAHLLTRSLSFLHIIAGHTSKPLLPDRDHCIASPFGCHFLVLKPRIYITNLPSSCTIEHKEGGRLCYSYQ